MEIDTRVYEAIANAIRSTDSPVGIDALKTHIYIIHKLHQIENRLMALERRLDGDSANS